MAEAKQKTAPTTAPAQTEKKNLAPVEKSMSMRFMEKVISEFATGVGDIALTGHQQRLAQNYFIGVDISLRMAEEKRLKKPEQYRDSVPITWANVNMEGLARSVVACARVGLDPSQKNHINMMPFKNNNTGKYDIVFIEGYRGIELKAVKYGMDVPDAVIVELVYTKDQFKVIKKSAKNPMEIYEFDVVDAFDRGEIKGGFYYHAYAKIPERNKLVVLSLPDILKRKPPKASPEFWGGEKDEYKDGKKTGKKEKVEGWFEKMCWKTLYRAAYNDITIDSQKIDSDYLQLKQMEESLTDSRVAAEIAEHANGEVLSINEAVIDGEFTAAELASDPQSTSGQQQPPADAAPVDPNGKGPGF